MSRSAARNKKVIIMAEIFVFGDSICAGAIDTKGGWVIRLQKYLVENDMLDYSTYLYNLGVDTHTSEDILARFEAETDSRLSRKQERKAFIFAFGINDSCFFKDGHVLVEKDVFEKNIRKIIAAQRKFGGYVFFVGLTPVYEKKTNPLPYSTTGKIFTNKRILEYNSILKSVCKEEGVLFVDLPKRLFDEAPSLVPDGIHPNNEAHEMIFEAVKNKLKNSMVFADWPKR